jgi:WD40 repeat protein
MDGQRIFTGSDGKTIKLWDAETGREVLTLRGQRGVKAIACSRDGRRLASLSQQDVLIYDADPVAAAQRPNNR